MTVQATIEKIEKYLSEDLSDVHVTADIYEQALDRKLPFVVIDEEGTEITSASSGVPHRTKTKISILCVVQAKNKTFHEYRKEAEINARNVITSLNSHVPELQISTNDFTNQEMLIGSVDVSGVSISCEIWVNY